MKIALIADEITSASLKKETNTYPVTPLNYKIILRLCKPDILFVESVWQGHRNSWKYKVAAYPGYPKRNNKRLQKVVAYAKKLGIPTLFWNKEDGVHFDRFIASAKLFDHIVTVDETCIEKYRSVVGSEVSVHTMMFAVQPRFHTFDGFDFKYNRACFAGSYSKHIHTKRRQWQQMFFETVTQSGMGLTVFDRNSKRKSDTYRYPEYENMDVKSAIAYDKTAQIYKEYLVSLNINTIEDSETMFSRRLIEILACGGIAVTTPSLAVEKYFAPYCHVVQNKKEMQELFERLKDGPSEEDLARARAGAEYIHKEHTWAHRLDEIKRIVGL